LIIQLLLLKLLQSSKVCLQIYHDLLLNICQQFIKVDGGAGTSPRGACTTSMLLSTF
jgi:hypothetical protein